LAKDTIQRCSEKGQKMERLRNLKRTALAKGPTSWANHLPPFLSYVLAILLLWPTASAHAFDLKQYMLTGFKANYRHLDLTACTDCTRYADSECCWNGTACIKPAPASCPAPNQDWWRWQFSYHENKAYDIFYDDNQTAPMIHYSATYMDCGLGYYAAGTNCTSVYILANSIVFAPRFIDEGCGDAPYGDGRKCPSGSGGSRVSFADYRGTKCTGTVNYLWNVMPGGEAGAGRGAGITDTYSTLSTDVDRTKPVVHVRLTIDESWDAGSPCALASDYEDWWFGSTIHGNKAPLITLGGPGVFMKDSVHWSLIIDN
jgi:hypothetical protein